MKLRRILHRSIMSFASFSPPPKNQETFECLLDDEKEKGGERNSISRDCSAADITVISMAGLDGP